VREMDVEERERWMCRYEREIMDMGMCVRERWICACVCEKERCGCERERYICGVRRERDVSRDERERDGYVNVCVREKEMWNEERKREK